jgi:hypothetical protein
VTEKKEYISLSLTTTNARVCRGVEREIYSFFSVTVHVDTKQYKEVVALETYGLARISCPLHRPYYLVQPLVRPTLPSRSIHLRRLLSCASSTKGSLSNR